MVLYNLWTEIFNSFCALAEWTAKWALNTLTWTYFKFITCISEASFSSSWYSIQDNKNKSAHTHNSQAGALFPFCVSLFSEYSWIKKKISKPTGISRALPKQQAILGCVPAYTYLCLCHSCEFIPLGSSLLILCGHLTHTVILNHLPRHLKTECLTWSPLQPCPDFR